MWFIVNTDRFQEQRTKEFLESTYPDIVKFVYLPKCRTKYVNAQGEERYSFRPLIYGLLFIKADSIKVLKRILSPWGYFVYEDTVRNLETGELQKEKLVSNAHLLCKDVKDLNQESIIKTATIPDEDMEHFIYFSDKMADGIEGLSIVDKRYDDLIQENDTIRLFSGPLRGWVGVVKQVKSKGKKDRHLFVRFGNNLCLSFSNVRQYEMQVEHEATKGPKAEAVGVWRAIDQDRLSSGQAAIRGCISSIALSFLGLSKEIARLSQSEHVGFGIRKQERREYSCPAAKGFGSDRRKDAK